MADCVVSDCDYPGVVDGGGGPGTIEKASPRFENDGRGRSDVRVSPDLSLERVRGVLVSCDGHSFRSSSSSGVFVAVR